MSGGLEYPLSLMELSSFGAEPWLESIHSAQLSLFRGGSEVRCEAEQQHCGLPGQGMHAQY